MNYLLQNNRVIPNRHSCRVAAYSFLLLSADLCNNPVIFGFAGAPGYTQKISLDCDERHHLPQTQGTTVSEKICFFYFLPSISIKKKAKEMICYFIRCCYLILFIPCQILQSQLLFCYFVCRLDFFFFFLILHHAVVHANFIFLIFRLSRLLQHQKRNHLIYILRCLCEIQSVFLPHSRICLHVFL